MWICPLTTAELVNNIYILRNTLQHTAAYCNAPQHTATYCNTLQANGPRSWRISRIAKWDFWCHDCNFISELGSLMSQLRFHQKSSSWIANWDHLDIWCKSSATHCNTLQHTATHTKCNARTNPHTDCNTLQHTATHTHCNTRTNPHTDCNTPSATHPLQHTLEFWNPKFSSSRTYLSSISSTRGTWISQKIDRPYAYAARLKLSHIAHVNESCDKTWGARGRYPGYRIPFSTFWVSNPFLGLVCTNKSTLHCAHQMVLQDM